MTVLFWIGFALEVLAICLFLLRAMQRQALKARGYVPPGDVARILKPAGLLAPLAGGGLAVLLTAKIAWLAALIVWLPLVAVIAWVLLMMIGGLSSGRWN